MRTTGCPASSSASSAASCVGIRFRGEPQVREQPVLAVDLRLARAARRRRGSRPLPSLPVDSASSCSSHAPKSAMAGDVDERQLVASRERAHAHHGAEHQAGVLVRRRCPDRTPRPRAARARASRRRPRRRRRRAPCRSSRAPSSGRRSSRARAAPRESRRRGASRSSAEPGIRDGHEPRRPPASPTASRALAKKYFFSTFGSSVDPDLLETKNRVRVRSIDASAARTWAGSVESRTRRAGAAVRAPEGLGEHLGSKARSSHPEQQGLLQAVRARLARRAGAARRRGPADRARRPASPASGTRRARSTASRRRPTGAPPFPRRSSPRGPPRRPPGDPGGSASFTRPRRS